MVALSDRTATFCVDNAAARRGRRDRRRRRLPGRLRHAIYVALPAPQRIVDTRNGNGGSAGGNPRRKPFAAGIDERVLRRRTSATSRFGQSPCSPAWSRHQPPPAGYLSCSPGATRPSSVTSSAELHHRPGGPQRRDRRAGRGRRRARFSVYNCRRHHSRGRRPVRLLRLTGRGRGRMPSVTDRGPARARRVPARRDRARRVGPRRPAHLHPAERPRPRRSRPAAGSRPGFVDAHCHIGLAPSGSRPRSRRPGRAGAARPRRRRAAAARRRLAGRQPVASRPATICPGSSAPAGTSPGPSATSATSASRSSPTQLVAEVERQAAGRRRLGQARGRLDRPRRRRSRARPGPTTRCGPAIARAHELGARVAAHVFGEDALPGPDRGRHRLDRARHGADRRPDRRREGAPAAPSSPR